MGISALRTSPMVVSLLGRLREPLSTLPLLRFRVAFGLLMAAALLRTMALGRVEALYIAPTMHFPMIQGLAPLPGWGMHALFGALVVAALLVAAGTWYRPSIVFFFVGFTYIELLDKSYYLNHYYLVSLLAFLMIWLPLGGGWRGAARVLPAWTLYALRLQVGVVYAFAGLAKLRGDWLLHALPLRLWLPARADLPLVGPWLEQPWLAFAMSWAGAAFDLTLPFWLLHRRTRPWAYVAIVLFHGLTALLFPTIGLFPWLMMAASLLFLPAPVPDPSTSALMRPDRAHRAVAPLIALLLGAQLLLPLRHLLYPGDVLWTGEGFRFAWYVMLVEKTGSALFRVRDPASGREWTVHPHVYLTPAQELQMSFQPDMAQQFAHALAASYRAQGFPTVEVYADMVVSLNGRPGQRLIDPTVNLAAEPMTLGHRAWLLPYSAP